MSLSGDEILPPYDDRTPFVACLWGGHGGQRRSFRVVVYGLEARFGVDRGIEKDYVKHFVPCMLHTACLVDTTEVLIAGHRSGVSRTLSLTAR